jgi:8-oxo-dGTP pyrophosphatase MutT (NUDIX family)
VTDERRQHVAMDGEDVFLESSGQQWLQSWHAGTVPPAGKPHGAAGICLTDSGEVVLVSSDGVGWGLPAGRPERDETWEQTLRREMLEEACAVVRDARLLGFARGRCIRGHEAGLVLVRSFWLAHVDIEPWNPLFEIAHRKLVPAPAVVSHITIESGHLPIFRRALVDAGIRLGPEITEL